MAEKNPTVTGGSGFYRRQKIRCAEDVSDETFDVDEDGVHGRLVHLSLCAPGLKGGISLRFEKKKHRFVQVNMAAVYCMHRNCNM